MRLSGKPARRFWQFVLTSPEPDNYTYEPDLAAWAATVIGRDLDLARRFVDSPRLDGAFTVTLRSATAGRWFWTKRLPPFGKRVGWRAVVRGLHPRLVIEIGAHDGLGSLLLLRGLELNQAEGRLGRLVSFDVNRTAGWIVGDHPLWHLRPQSSQAGMVKVLSASGPLDLFIYDGWHTSDAEYADLRTAAAHLSPQGALLSDDAQVTSALLHLCQHPSFGYLEFREGPMEHFYPGALLAAGRR